MAKLTLILAVLVIRAMLGGQLIVSAMDTGGAMQQLAAQPVAAYSAGSGD